MRVLLKDDEGITGINPAARQLVSMHQSFLLGNERDPADRIP
jgi:hypothetical protein